MSATKHATDLAFIAVTAANGTTPEARKLIRSHVMRGKRWRKKPRGTRTEASADAVKGSDSATAAIEQHFRLLKALQYGIPNKVGSDLSFIQFADHIEPCAFADFVRCMLTPILRMNGSYLMPNQSFYRL